MGGRSVVERTDDSLSTMLIDNGVATAPTIEQATVASSGTYAAPTVTDVQTPRVSGSEIAEAGPHWYDQRPVGQGAPVAGPATSGEPAAAATASEPTERTALWTILCGIVAAVLAAIAWAIFTDLTNHVFTTAGLAMRTDRRLRRPLVCAALWRDQDHGRDRRRALLRQHRARLDPRDDGRGRERQPTSTCSPRSTRSATPVGGWTGALPFHDPWTWGVLGLATVEGYYIALLPRGADSAWALQPMQTSPGMMPAEPPSSQPLEPPPTSPAPATDDRDKA